MRKLFALSLLTAIVVSLSLIANAAHAQLADRTWVSGTGDDGNACSRTAPCKTFGAAIAKTSIHGEINCLDAGGFGPVTIQKSVTIDCHDGFAGITYAPSTPYFAPFALQILFESFDPSDAPGQVILRNLVFNGLGRGTVGIEIEGAMAGSMVNIEGCVIDGNAGTNGTTSSGIYDQRTRGALIINNTTVRNNAGGTGIYVGAIRAAISNTRVTNSTVGIEASTSSNVVLDHSLVSNNATAGLMVQTGGVMIVDSTTISHNGNGIQNSGTARLSNSDLILNTAAISGSVQSFTNNRFSNNGSIGTIVPIGTAANPTGEQ
jgi:parallel beta helix pectate lyase-like protein